MASPHRTGEYAPAVFACQQLDSVALTIRELSRMSILGIHDERQVAATIAQDIEKQTSTASMDGASIDYDLLYLRGSDPAANPLVFTRDGFLTTKEHADDYAMALTGLGYTVVNNNPVRNLPLRKAATPTHIVDPLKRQSQGIWAVVKDVRAQGLKRKATFIGHSMGLPIMMDMVAHHPEEAEQVIGIQPAAQGHGKLEVIGDFIVCAATDLLPGALKSYRANHLTDHGRNVASHVATSLFQIGHEAFGVSGRDSRQQSLEFMERGGKVYVVLGQNDKVFRPKKYIPRITGFSTDHGVIPAVGHGSPQFQPVTTALATDSWIKKGQEADSQLATIHQIRT